MPRTVLITGASMGIGAAAAQLLASRDFEVFGTSRRPEALPDGAPAIHWIPMDVRDETSVNAGVEQVRKRCGALDAIVCNAGFGIFGSIEETSLEDAGAQLDTNFFGVLRTLRAVIPHMRERRSGRIVIVGSLAGRAPIPFQAHYSASKAAVDSVAMALRMELQPYGVTVSLVEPGDINTPFNDATDFGTTERSAYADRIRRCRKVIEDALPRAPGPELVAHSVHRALTARRPRVRYPVGPDSLLVPFGRRLLPDWLTLRVIRAQFGL